MQLPPGRTNLKVVVGVGDARIRLPEGACSTTDAHIGAGATDLPDDHRHGFDVAVADAAVPHGDRPVVHIDAHVGLGYLRVQDGAGCA
jgi:hypothetical protein